MYYSLDPITRVKGVGEKKGEALVNLGITCVGDLRTLVDNDDKKKELVVKTAGVGIKFLCNFFLRRIILLLVHVCLSASSLLCYFPYFASTTDSQIDCFSHLIQSSRK